MCAVQLETSVQVIVACFVLHNLCIDAGDQHIVDDEHQLTPGQQAFYDTVPTANYNGSQRPGATAVRDALIAGQFTQCRSR